ncbi:MAG TPA: EF-hand domain-containing protein [Planctomycetaceae bacterium]|nr:EF-hand domain-containing protein [Planctomycetaceae bacterium]
MAVKTFAVAGIACLIGVPLFAQDTNPQSEFFKKLDTNGDGFVTAEEVGKDKAELFDRLIKLGDEDQDQKLTPAELSKALKPAQPQPIPNSAQPGGPERRGGAPNPADFFARLDRDGDGTLTRSEIPEPLKERFEAVFEKTGKESLTQAEFTEALPQIGRANAARERLPLDEAGLKEFFNRMDQNQDGTVTTDEIPERARQQFAPLLEQLGKEAFTLEEFSKFAVAVRQVRPGDAGTPEGRRFSGRFPGSPDGQPRGPVFFGMLDKDQNGKLSPTELAFAVTLIEQLDRNEDGELDAGEIMGFRPGQGGPGMRGAGGRPETDAARPARPKRPEGAGNPERPGESAGDDFAKRFFERFDTDSDGFITRSEAPERMAENFGNLDRNKDDKLSLEEFQSSVGPRGGRPND